jgi:hypothetical protein
MPPLAAASNDRNADVRRLSRVAAASRPSTLYTSLVQPPASHGDSERAQLAQLCPPKLPRHLNKIATVRPDELVGSLDNFLVATVRGWGAAAPTPATLHFGCLGRHYGRCCYRRRAPTHVIRQTAHGL